MRVSCRDLVPLIARDALARRAAARFTVSGSSMSPLLREGDTVELAALGDDALHVGDIVLARRTDDQYVMHRVGRVDGPHCFLLGDAQTELEGPFTRAQIVGRVTAAWRRGRPLPMIGPAWRLAGRLWCAAPVPRARLLAGLRRCRRALARLRGRSG